MYRIFHINRDDANLFDDGSRNMLKNKMTIIARQIMTNYLNQITVRKFEITYVMSKSLRNIPIVMIMIFFRLFWRTSRKYDKRFFFFITNRLFIKGLALLKILQNTFLNFFQDVK